MQSRCAFSLLFAVACTTGVAEGARKNPLSAVIELLENLAEKVTADSVAEAKAYKEYANYCRSTKQNLGFELETSSAAKDKLEATIEDLASAIEVATSKIEDAASAIAKTEGELKSAVAIRKTEATDFSASEKELLETIDTLGRASGILSKQMAKNPAALAQIDTTNMASMMHAFSVMVDAAALSSNDKKKLVALVQAQQSDNDDDDDEEPGAPTAAAYKTHSGSILEILEDLKDKAEIELADLRKAEMDAKHKFALLKQSYEDSIAAEKKEMAAQKDAKAAAAEEKAADEGDLAATEKDLADTTAALKDLTADCATKKEDHEASVAGFTAELKVIAEATGVLKEKTSGAVSQTYSFLQLQSRSKAHARAHSAGSEVVALVKKVAREQHSAALSQLASRITAVLRYGHLGEDPFAKVKGLISDLLAKLQAQAEEEATEKAFCDEEMKKTEAKKEELQTYLKKLSIKIAKASAKSAELKEEVSATQAELSELHSKRAEMDKIRSMEHAAYTEAKADLTEGLEGVNQAMKVLKEYYATESSAALLQSDAEQPEAPPTYSKSTGAGASIIDILETVESDFAKDLADKETAEEDAVSVYEKDTQDMKVTQAVKEKDVEYKTKEFTALDKTISDLTADKEGQSTELSAVLEYDEKLKERCIAKPETYEARKARRTAEINGLKEALAILEDQTAFVQQGRRGMRGARALGILQ